MQITCDHCGKDIWKWLLIDDEVLPLVEGRPGKPRIQEDDDGLSVFCQQCGELTNLRAFFARLARHQTEG